MGFRLGFRVRPESSVIEKFPSLSESSGFPTSPVMVINGFHSFRFPSLSESSGFPTVYVVEGKNGVYKVFPSLSESSGFPTGGVRVVKGVFRYFVSISFRE